MNWGAFKEGFSLFNLFDFTVTPWGRNHLRQMFAAPLKSLDHILARQKSIKFLEALDFKSAQGQGVILQKLLKLLKTTGSVALLLKNRGMNTAQTVQLLDKACWQTIHRNITLFLQMNQIILDVMPELSEQELEEVKNSKLVQLHNEMNLETLVEI